jgi:hypothetical protein
MGYNRPTMRYGHHFLLSDTQHVAIDERSQRDHGKKLELAREFLVSIT